MREVWRLTGYSIRATFFSILLIGFVALIAKGKMDYYVFMSYLGMATLFGVIFFVFFEEQITQDITPTKTKIFENIAVFAGTTIILALWRPGL